MTPSGVKKRCRSDGAEEAGTGPRSLTELPQEILRRIASLLDSSDALNLARTNKTLSSTAEPAIWRDIKLPLAPSYGTQPLVTPCTETDDPERYYKWVIDVSKEAEKQRGLALKKRINSMMLSLNERNIRYVESLDVVPRRGANTAIVQLLDLLSPVLKRLNLHAEVRSSHRRLGIKDHEKLSFKLLDFGILGTTFSALTHLTLDHVLDYYDLLPLICNIATNLETVDITFAETARTEWITAPHSRDVPDKPTYQRPTGIRKLRILPIMPDGYEAGPILCELLKYCPRLEFLSVEIADFDETLVEQIQETLKDHAMLQELRLWVISTHIFCEERRNRCGPDTFKAVETCVLWVNDVLAGGRTPCISIPHMPNLRVLYLMEDSEAERLAPGIPYDPVTSAFRRLTPDEAASIRAASPLEKIQLAKRSDNTERPDPFVPVHGCEIDGVPVGSRIFSYRYLDKEILHVRTYDRSVCLKDAAIEQSSVESMDSENETEFVRYIDNTGTEREQEFMFGKDMAWEDATEYDGEGIPLEVIGRMRQAAGAGFEAWEKRGVQVNGEVWQILEDYLVEIRNAAV